MYATALREKPDLEVTDNSRIINGAGNKDDRAYSSDFGSDDEDEICINKEYNVLLRSSKHDREQLKKTKATLLTADEKNKQFSIANLPKDFVFVSEVFKIDNLLTNEADNGFLQLPKEADQIILTIPLQRKHRTVDDNFFHDYSVWRHDGSTWSLLPVTFKDGYVEFNCGKLKYFGIVCCPRIIRNKVTPCGSSFDVSTNCNITLTFEKGCVKQTEHFIYTVQESEIDYGYSEKYKAITNASYKVNFEYDKSKFVKPMKIELRNSNIGTPKTECEVQLVGYINETMTIRKRASVRKDGTYFGKVQGVDGVCFVAVKKKKGVFTTDEKLTKELDLVYNRRVLCHILLFYHKKVNSTLYFTAECCPANDKDIRKTKYKSKGDKLIFESKHLYLPTHQRMRVRPTSCIGTKPGNASHFVFYFISASKDNNISFEVEVKRQIGGSPNAIIEFSTDNKQNLEITKAEFNLDSLLFQRKKPKPEKSPEIDPPVLNKLVDPDCGSETIKDIELDDRNVISKKDIVEEDYDYEVSENEVSDDEINETCSPAILSPENTTISPERYEQ